MRTLPRSSLKGLNARFPRTVRVGGTLAALSVDQPLSKLSTTKDSLLDGADNVKESSRSGSNSRSDILKHRRRARFQIKGSAQTDLATSEQQSTVLTQAKPPSASRPAVARLRNRDRTRGRVSHTSDTREEQLEEQHAAVKTVPDQITRIETGMPNPDEDVSEAQESVSSIPRVEAQEQNEVDKDGTEIDNVFKVENITQAVSVMSKLRDIVEKDPGRIFACDTEVKDIDVLNESPKGHGSVICFSVYCGDDVNFGNGPEDPPLTHLWVDTMGDEVEFSQQMLNAFKEFFENPKFKKVWHNYGFDRHVLTNMKVHCRGFWGDTMHMARLWDASRRGKGYSLESLSEAEELNGKKDSSKKTSMKKLFGKPKIKKDGSEGKTIVVPSVEELQTDQAHRSLWIHYSARDAKATFDLYHALKDKLSHRKESICYMDDALKSSYPGLNTLWDFYTHVWRPFGELLTDMEDEGFYVNKDHLKKSQEQAEKDRKEASDRFQAWAKHAIVGGEYLNPASDAQIRMMLFAGLHNRKKNEVVESFRIVKVPNPEHAKHKEEERKGRAPRKMMGIKVHSLWRGEKSPLKPKILTASGWPAVSGAALRSLVGKPGAARSLLNKEYGASPADTSIPTLLDSNENGSLHLEDHLVNSNAREGEVRPTGAEVKYGRCLEAAQNGLGPLFTVFQNKREGLEACVAVEALVEISAIDTLLSSFIIPLQEDKVKAPDGRIHGSMNINTETGRLSCRRPNLQNQPSLEKDRYKVRQSFQAEKGKTLIVADYGQLELRVLAHLTNCKSMLEAFKGGGDFHSRTAAGMYDHIRQEIEAGKVALEKGSEDEDIPLVKDMYASERRRAKVLNFSIAYGKTAHGLSKDWEVSIEEAEQTLQRWYSDRKEVKKWQSTIIAEGERRGYVTTLLGRRRKLPRLNSKQPFLKSAAERAAINTPIQGSAADIATAAMLAIKNNERLKVLDWKLLSQVHDEVILEGPQASVEEAQKLVVRCMEKPFPTPDGTGYHNPLKVALVVDSKHADTWYDAK